MTTLRTESSDETPPSSPPSDERLIVVAELNFSGHTHARFNASILEVLGRAFPERTIRFVAMSDHLEYATAQVSDEVTRRLEGVPVEAHPALQGAVARHFRDRADARHPVIRLRRASSALQEAWAAATDQGTRTGDLVLASFGPQLLTAAWMLRARKRGPRCVEAIMHGNLSEIEGWRSRRPLYRALDLRAAVRRWLKAGLPLTVLEPHIEDEVRKAFPALPASSRIPVFPLPVCASGLSAAGRQLQKPVDIGFLGIATEDKGLHTYLDVARRIGAPDRSDVRFRICGRLAESTADADLTALHDSVTREAQPRDVYQSILEGLHYACLPLSSERYRFSASASIIDAVEQLKPIITIAGPLTDRFFREAGDVGYLCDTPQDMVETIEMLLTELPEDRYRTQVANLKTLRDRRGPDAQGRDLRRLWFACGNGEA